MLINMWYCSEGGLLLRSPCRHGLLAQASGDTHGGGTCGGGRPHPAHGDTLAPTTAGLATPMAPRLRRMSELGEGRIRGEKRGHNDYRPDTREKKAMRRLMPPPMASSSLTYVLYFLRALLSTAPNGLLRVL